MILPQPKDRFTMRQYAARWALNLFYDDQGHIARGYLVSLSRLR